MSNHYMRSVLFVPANKPGMLHNSYLFGADAIIYDLEDAISIDQKDAARILLDESFNFFKKTNIVRIVRINPLDSPFFYKDIEVIKKHDIDYIMLPKADVGSVKALEKEIKDTNIKIISLIESAYSLFDLSNILTTSKLVEGMLFGAEDFSLDMQIERTKQSDEILMARQNIALTCKALNKFCIDTPFTDVNDEDALRIDTHKVLAYGFNSKSCIHPNQVRIVNEVFTPTKEKIEDSLEIIRLAKEAKENGLGVFAYKGKMVDAPVINRAKNTLENAKKAGVKYE